MTLLLLACVEGAFPRGQLDNPRHDYDGDGFTEWDGDCNDASVSTHPGASELCNGRDDDCDGTIDGGSSEDAPLWFRDVDQDGHGGLSQAACEQPDGWLSEGGDCDDGDAAIHPAATETCDGVDQDCDGGVDEGLVELGYLDEDGDGWGTSESIESCTSVPAEQPGDCDDEDASINPAATEAWYDGVDQDCDGRDRDPDADGFDQDEDCDDSDSAVHPGATEVCDNGVDDDCDGNSVPCRDEGELLIADEATLTVKCPTAAEAYCGFTVEVLADWDGDGVGELLITGGHPNGSLGFTTWSVPADETGVVSLDNSALEVFDNMWVDGAVVADLDGDGSLERFVAGHGADGQTVYLYGDAWVANTGIPGVGAGDLVTGDIDDDGLDDLLFGTSSFTNGGAVWIFNGPISANPWGSHTAIRGLSSGLGSGVAVTDLDGDGSADLAIGGYMGPGQQGAVYIFQGPVTSANADYNADVQLPRAFTSRRMGWHVDSADDIDGDGLGDLLVSHAGDDGGVSLYTGGLDGEVWASFAGDEGGAQGAWGTSAVLVDFDGDGHRDLVAGAPGHVGGVVGVHYGPLGAGSYIWDDLDLVLSGDGADTAGYSMDAEDLDGDGKADLFIGAPYSNRGVGWLVHGRGL